MPKGYRDAQTEYIRTYPLRTKMLYFDSALLLILTLNFSDLSMFLIIVRRKIYSKLIRIHKGKNLPHLFVLSV